MEITKEQEVLKRVINKAWEDETFKQELIENPVTAIEKFIGERLNIPEGKELIVRDQTSDKIIYINIPAEEILDDVELNEEQLSSVAGGIEGKGCISDPIGDKIREGSNTFNGLL